MPMRVKRVTYAHLGPIWYHSEPSDIPYSQKQFLDRDFFGTSYSRAALAVFFFVCWHLHKMTNFLLLTWAGAWNCLTDVWMINGIKRRYGRTWFLDLTPGWQDKAHGNWSKGASIKVVSKFFRFFDTPLPMWAFFYLYPSANFEFWPLTPSL